MGASANLKCITTYTAGRDCVTPLSNHRRKPTTTPFNTNQDSAKTLRGEAKAPLPDSSDHRVVLAVLDLFDGGTGCLRRCDELWALRMSYPIRMRRCPLRGSGGLGPGSGAGTTVDGVASGAVGCPWTPVSPSGSWPQWSAVRGSLRLIQTTWRGRLLAGARLSAPDQSSRTGRCGGVTTGCTTFPEPTVRHVD